MYGYSARDVDLRLAKKDLVPINLRTHETFRANPPAAVSLGCHCVQGVLPTPRRNGVADQSCGLKRRLGLEMPRVNRQTLKEFRGFVFYWMQRIFSPLPANTDFSFDHWINQVKYRAVRKAELKQLHERLPRHWSNRLWRKYSICKAFLKSEWYTNVGGCFKPPRVISSRSDAIKTKVGPMIHAIENVIFSTAYFIKHIPMTERPDWILKRMGGYTRYASTDFTSFEAGYVGAVMRACEFTIFKYMLRNNAQLYDTLEKFQRICTGVNRLYMHDVSAAVHCKRMSGEMTTSVGNGLTNLFLIGFAMSRQNPHFDMAKFVGVFEGDDGLFPFPEPLNEKQFSDDIAELGFIVKISLSKTIGEAGFCSQFMDTDDNIVVTDPVDEILSLGWSLGETIHCNDRRLRELLVAKAYSLAYQYSGCPVLYKMARWIIRAINEQPDWDVLLEKPYWNNWERDQMRAASRINLQRQLEREPKIATRLLMEKIFRFPIADQLRCESWFDNTNEICIIDMPWLEKYVGRAASLMRGRISTFRVGISWTVINAIRC